MGKNDKEKDLLYEWGVTNHDAYQFMTIDKDAKSYFRNRQNHNYLREYYFGTLPYTYCGKGKSIWMAYCNLY